MVIRAQKGQEGPVERGGEGGISGGVNSDYTRISNCGVTKEVAATMSRRAERKAPERAVAIKKAAIVGGRGRMSHW